MDKNMRRIGRTWAGGLLARIAAGAGMALLAVGMLASPLASAAVGNTKHNLGSTGTGVNKFDGTGEICVFCHTPHGAAITAVVPLWNRTMATPSTYTTYNSLGTSSLDGMTAPVGSVSLACLSCHDGTQAMNVMINTPGSGTTTTLAGNWTGANQTLGVIASGAITNLGKDLQSDHPVGIQYAGGPKSGTVPAAGAAYGSTLFKDADFKAANSQELNGQPVWWVDTAAGTAGSREKTDMQLYTRTGMDSVKRDGTLVAGAITGSQPFVECASCHDPHSEEKTFLRIANTGSLVCLACHTK